MAASAFARSQMAKMGWRDGQGLGAQKQGRSEAIKPKLKFDLCGIGHDNGKFGEEFRWWDQVFNRAASNIIVDDSSSDADSSDDEDVSKANNKRMRENKEESFVTVRSGNAAVGKSISIYGMTKSRNKALLYGSFIKSKETLVSLDDELNKLQQETNSSDDDDDDDDDDDVSTLTSSKTRVVSEAEMFRACGGRTCHKAASRGISSCKAKLDRLAAQEAEFMAKYGNGNTTSTESVKAPKKKIEKKNRCDASTKKKIEYSSDVSKEKKKKKKKNLDTNDNEVYEKGDSSNVLKTKKKRKLEDNDSAVNDGQRDRKAKKASNDVEKESKKKSRKSKTDDNTEDDNPNRKKK